MSHSKRHEDEEAASRSSGDFVVRSTSTVERTSSEFVWCRTSSAVPATSVDTSVARPSWVTTNLPTMASSTPSTSAEGTTTAAKLSLPPGSQIVTGFKHYGPRIRLYCRTGFCVTVLADRSVIGDPLGSNSSGVLEFTSAGIGEVRIRGVEANLYLAMNSRGILYGEEDPRDYATVFVESVYDQYTTYLSQKYAHRGWYVGIKKNGAIKKASQTKWGQKAIQFLPLRA